MKKQIKLTLCSIVAFMSFSLFAGTQNACAAEYYGSIQQPTLDSALTCTAYPDVCGNVETSSNTGAYSVDSCYAPVGATGNNTKGAFKLKTAACASEN